MLDLWYDFWNWITPVNPAVPAMATLTDFNRFAATTSDAPVALATLDDYVLDVAELT